jgi:hypothetical protein
MRDNNDWQASLDDWDWEAIPADVDAVLFKWWTTLRAAPPWSAMPADDALGVMRLVVSELLNEARHPSDGLRGLRLAEAAQAHGRFRRRQQCDRTALGGELAALVDALKNTMLDANQSPSLVRDCLLLLDGDLELARKFALLGWRAAQLPIGLNN